MSMRHRSRGRKTAGVSIAFLAVLGACSSSTSNNAAGCGPAGSGSLAGMVHPAGGVDSVFPLTGRPFGVAISSSGVVLIGRQDANDVVRGSISNFTFPTTIPVGNDPGTLAFSPGGTEAAVSNYNDFTVGFVSLGTNTESPAPSVGTSPFQVKYHPTGTRVYVGTSTSGIRIFDASTHAARPGILAGSHLNGMVFSPNACKLYVSSVSDGTVAEISTVNDSLLRLIPTGAGTQEIAISPDSSELWVANEAQGIKVYALPSGDSVATLAGTAGAWGLAMSPDGQQLYTTLPTVGTMKIIDRASRTVLGTMFLGVPRRVAFDKTGAHAVVADEIMGAIRIH